ncbi:restriction endonuclease subunit S [Glaciibacter superstes]|uniref:restriction endonuclease subunit S n=1 Tax=Glaciibacter superstes TaxID=501023 RepID=UPI0003B3703F|nr:restriction endonuclease subunit S [Glaciibacter superstes]
MSFETVVLGSVLSVDSRSVMPEAISGGTTYVGLESIGRSGALDESITVRGGELRSNKFAFDRRHVLFGKLRPNLGKIARPSGSGVCSTDIYPLLPSDRLDRGYLAHFLLRPESIEKAASRTSGVNLPRISAAVLNSFEIPLPPLPEQRRIAAILDQTDELRTKRHRALTLLDQLADSVFEEMFDSSHDSSHDSSTTSALANHCLQITDGEHQTPRRTMSGHKLLSARNVRNGYLDFTSVDYVGDDEYARIAKRCRPAAGDVLISCSGSVGRVAMIRSDEEFVLVRSVALVRPDASIDPVYLEQYLQTPRMQEEMKKRVNLSAQANLFQAQIKSLPIYVPPMSEQISFSRRFELISTERDKQREGIRYFDELFASLQHRAFRGEL